MERIRLSVSFHIIADVNSNGGFLFVQSFWSFAHFVNFSCFVFFFCCPGSVVISFVFPFAGDTVVTFTVSNKTKRCVHCDKLYCWSWCIQLLWIDCVSLHSSAANGMPALSWIQIEKLYYPVTTVTNATVFVLCMQKFIWINTFPFFLYLFVPCAVCMVHSS